MKGRSGMATLEAGETTEAILQLLFICICA